MTKFERTIQSVVAVLLLVSSTCWGATTAKEVIKVGTSQSLTGHFADFGQEQLQGLQMWVEDINTRGSLLGKTVELVYYDDQSSPRECALAYRRLIEEDKVDLLIGPYSSDLTLVASVVSELYAFPMVTTAASADLIWQRGFDNIFGIDTPSSEYMHVAIESAAKRGNKTVAMVYADAEFTRQVAEGVRGYVSEKGMKLVLDEKYPRNQKDFSELSGALKEINADIVLGASYFRDSVELTKAMEANAVEANMVVFTVGPTLREFGIQLGDQATGILGVVQWLRSVRLPRAQDFAYRFRQKYGYNPGVHAAIGYSAGQVTEAAVRLAETTERRAVHDQLHGLNFRSLLGHYQVDDTGRQIGKANHLMQWQEGNRRLVEPQNLAESEMIYPKP